MIQTRHYNNLIWVDVESPTTEEILELVNTYGLTTRIGEDMRTSSSKPRIEYHDTYIYLVLHIPVRTKVKGKYIIEEKEIDFIIAKDFLITIKYTVIESLHNFSKVFETDSIIDKKNIGNHAGFIFYYMLKRIYAHMISDLESMKGSLVYAEGKIFAGDEKHMVQVLSNLSRELIDLKQASRLHKEVIENFAPIAHRFFGDDFRSYIDDILKEYGKIHELVGNHRELLNELRETNDSILSTNQNEIMKTLTVVAFIAFPLTVISEIFTMNTAYTPILGRPYDFEIILGIMLVVVLSIFAIVKYKKWL
jgi:magnesium transporter